MILWNECRNLIFVKRYLLLNNIIDIPNAAFGLRQVPPDEAVNR